MDDVHAPIRAHRRPLRVGRAGAQQIRRRQAHSPLTVFENHCDSLRDQHRCPSAACSSVTLTQTTRTQNASRVPIRRAGSSIRPPPSMIRPAAVPSSQREGSSSAGSCGGRRPHPSGVKRRPIPQHGKHDGQQLTAGGHDGLLGSILLAVTNAVAVGPQHRTTAHDLMGGLDQPPANHAGAALADVVKRGSLLLRGTASYFGVQ